MINFHPKKGQILFCDFRGFEAPEMVKTRPILIITGSMIGKDSRLVTIVPISITTPKPICKWHYKLEAKYMPRAKFFRHTDCWVKADMIYTVSIKRLWLIKLGLNEFGKMKYFRKKLSSDIFIEVKKAILAGLDN